MASCFNNSTQNLAVLGGTMEDEEKGVSGAVPGGCRMHWLVNMPSTTRLNYSHFRTSRDAKPLSRAANKFNYLADRLA